MIEILNKINIFVRLNWKATLSFAFLLVAVIDIFFKSVSIIAASFIGLAALPWIIDLFEKITLPGGFELVLKKVSEKLDKDVIAPTAQDEEQFRYMNFEDPNIAMVALRIEIEKKIRKITEAAGLSINSSSRGIPNALANLERRGLVSSEASSTIRDMLPTLNAAAHGAILPSESGEWVLRNGPRLLASLELPEG